MRSLLFSILLIACSKESEPRIDASIHIVDAPRPPDAPPPDAAPDAPNMNVTQACMHACDAIATCAGEPPAPGCYTECAFDLADCTEQQVMEIDACSKLECGDPNDPENSPLITCIMAITCVDAALTSSRR